MNRDKETDHIREHTPERLDEVDKDIHENVDNVHEKLDQAIRESPQDNQGWASKDPTTKQEYGRMSSSEKAKRAQEGRGLLDRSK